MSVSPGRVPFVDVLRGLAIFVVVVMHTLSLHEGWVLPWKGNFRDIGSELDWLEAGAHLMPLGWSAVALFFVLSGFCIHWGFLTNPAFTAGAFLRRRFWRIYPAYVIALLVFSAMALPGIWSLKGAWQFWSHVFLVHSVHKSAIFAINPSFWSIAVEFQIYLLYPLLLRLRARVGIKGVLAGTLGLATVVKLLYVLRSGWPVQSIMPGWSWPPGTWFDWALGAYVAECYVAGRRAFRHRRWWLAISVALLAGSMLWRPGLFLLFSLSAVVSAVILDWGLERPPQLGVAGRALAAVGLVSYSFYLWHQPLLPVLESLLRPWCGAGLTWPAVYVVLLGLAYLSYRCLEQPGIALGRRLAARARAGAGSAAGT